MDSFLQNIIEEDLKLEKYDEINRPSLSSKLKILSKCTPKFELEKFFDKRNQFHQVTHSNLSWKCSLSSDDESDDCLEQFSLDDLSLEDYDIEKASSDYKNSCGDEMDINYEEDLSALPSETLMTPCVTSSSTPAPPSSNWATSMMITSAAADIIARRRRKRLDESFKGIYRNNLKKNHMFFNNFSRKKPVQEKCKSLKPHSDSKTAHLKKKTRELNLRLHGAMGTIKILENKVQSSIQVEEKLKSHIVELQKRVRQLCYGVNDKSKNDMRRIGSRKKTTSSTTSSSRRKRSINNRSILNRSNSDSTKLEKKMYDSKILLLQKQIKKFQKSESILNESLLQQQKQHQIQVEKLTNENTTLRSLVSTCKHQLQAFKSGRKKINKKNVSSHKF